MLCANNRRLVVGWESNAQFVAVLAPDT